MKSNLTCETSLPAPVEFPAPVAALLREHHRGCAGPDECAGCASACCGCGGFAILENVQFIYERYKAGTLQRADYQFAGGLNFHQFVECYFDIMLWCEGDPDAGEGLLIFHVRSLGPGGNPVAIPPLGHYWEVREALFDHNPWLSRGCIFLSESGGNGTAPRGWLADDGRTHRHCILHDGQSGTHLGAKPIDCVFHACIEPLRTKAVDKELSDRWLAALAASYPGSPARFEALEGEAG